MLPLSANNDFKNVGDAKGENPYRDWNAESLVRHAEVYGPDAIDQAIESVIVTEPYERLFNPEFFSPFYKLLFQNEGDADAIIEEVFRRIELWCNVEIDRANAWVSVDSANHSVELTIPYKYGTGFYHVFSRAISA